MKAEKRNDDFLKRGYTAEFRAVGDDEEKRGHIIEGIASMYEQESHIRSLQGDFVEIIRKGAFDETDFSDVKLFVNHNLDGIALARSRGNKRSDKPDTMQILIDEKGLNIKADLDTENNEEARALYSAINRGDMDEMSFCFFVEKGNQKWSKRNGVIYREIFKVRKVTEVSVVNYPASLGTNINSRSLDSDQRSLDSFLKSLDNDLKQKPVNWQIQTLISMYGGKKK